MSNILKNVREIKARIALNESVLPEYEHDLERLLNLKKAQEVLKSNSISYDLDFDEEELEDVENRASLCKDDIREDKEKLLQIKIQCKKVLKILKDLEEEK
jgi:hypothetical protein